MSAPRHPVRKWLWGLLAAIACPIAGYAVRARQRACGCLSCAFMLARPEIERRLLRALAEGPLGVDIDGDRTPKPVGPN